MFHTTPARAPSAEGHRIIWVRSSTKINRDAEARRARIAKAIAALDDLNGRLASPKTRIRTIAAVEAVPPPRSTPPALPAGSASPSPRPPRRPTGKRNGLLCQFLALLTEALIERQIRTAMKAAELANIPLYPELRACPAPSAPRILDIFNSVARHHLIDHGRVTQTFEPTLTPLQHQVLDLLDIPTDTYTNGPTQP